jgi:hypothetical protein
VQTKRLAPRTRRPVLVLFDRDDRLLQLTSKVLCRRLKEGMCLFASVDARAVLRACRPDNMVAEAKGDGVAAASVAVATTATATASREGSGGAGGGVKQRRHTADSDGGAAARMLVLWMENDVAQQAEVPVPVALATDLLHNPREHVGLHAHQRLHRLP